MKTKASIAVWMLSVAMGLASDHIVGAGMELSKGSENGPPKIEGVVPGAPAATAGIQAGWILLSVNGTNTAGRSPGECASLVRGKEDTRVRLELADPARGRTNKVTLTRVKILTPGSGAKDDTP